MSSQQKSGSYTGPEMKGNMDNRSNQCNPNNQTYQGHTSGYGGTGTRADLGNHSSQLNPNNSRYQAPKK